MPRDEQAAKNNAVDADLVSTIAREVIARLKATLETKQTSASVDDRIITTHTIEKLNGTPKQLFIASRAIVTPAARDEARRRGIAINRTVPLPQTQQPEHARLEITDDENPDRAESVRTQVARRGGAVGSARIVLSESPAREVYQQCAAGGEIAVMITSVNDVERFGEELSPTVWVLDMKRLNLPAAINTVVRITQLGKQTS